MKFDVRYHDGWLSLVVYPFPIQFDVRYHGGENHVFIYFLLSEHTFWAFESILLKEQPLPYLHYQASEVLNMSTGTNVNDWCFGICCSSSLSLTVHFFPVETNRGLVNDGLYAELFSQSKWLSSTWGPRRIKQVNLLMFLFVHAVSSSRGPQKTANLRS
jgi:hypothetical protein